MKYTALTMLLFLIVKLAYTQVDTNSIIESAHTKGILLVNSFQNEEYDTFLDLNHKTIIELMGGRDKMKELFKKGFGEGVKLLNITLKKPDKIFITDSIVQCLLEQKQVIEADQQRFYTISSLIGISYNLGETWYFIGVTNNTLADLKKYFPELDNDLEIRKQTLPVLIE